MWRYLAYLWGVGASLLALSIAGGPDAQPHVAALGAISVIAYAVSALVLVVSNRVTPAWTHPIVVLGNVLIASLVLLSAEHTSYYSLFYVWLNVYAFYFFPPRQAWAHTAFALFSYAAILLMETGHVPFTQWLMIAGTLVFVGAMVGSLSGRVTRLMNDLAAIARQDPLTGLLNRRGFHELLDVELERARRQGHQLSLLIADLDHFKRINDTFGHDAGDDVLRRVGELLNVADRPYDAAARMGGEELALLVPGTDAAGAYILAERLRRQLSAMLAGDAHAVTMSLGIATFPDHATGTADLLGAADEAMYAAKRLGRDRTEISRRAHGHPCR